MVSISANEVNLRTAPSTTSKVKWVLGRGFPLQVLHSKGKWLKVRDFENDSGWVYAPLTSSKGHMAVKKKIVNIRSGPGTKYRIVAQAKYGVVFRTITQIKGGGLKSGTRMEPPAGFPANFYGDGKKMDRCSLKTQLLGLLVKCPFEIAVESCPFKP